MAEFEYSDFGSTTGVLIIASAWAPDHELVTYWVDLVANPDGKVIKYWSATTDTWEKLLTSSSSGGGGESTPELDEIWQIVSEQQDSIVILQGLYSLLLKKMQVYTEDILSTNDYVSSLSKQVIQNTEDINILAGTDVSQTIKQLQDDVSELLNNPGIPTLVNPRLDEVIEPGTYKVTTNPNPNMRISYTLIVSEKTSRGGNPAYMQIRIGNPSSTTGIERRTFNIDDTGLWSDWKEIGESEMPIVPAADNVYIRYATNEDYSDFLQARAEDALFMGVQVNRTGSEIQDIAEYKWSRIKGAQGLKGEIGSAGLRGPVGLTPNHTFTLYKVFDKNATIDIPATNKAEFVDINVGVNGAINGWSRVPVNTQLTKDQVLYQTTGWADTLLNKVTRYQDTPVKVTALDGKDMTDMWDFKYKSTVSMKEKPSITNKFSKTALLSEGWSDTAPVTDSSRFVWATKGKFSNIEGQDNMIVEWSEPILMNREGDPGIQGATIRMVGEFTKIPKTGAEGEDLYYQSGNDAWDATVTGTPFSNNKFIDVVFINSNNRYYYYRCDKAVKIQDAPTPGTSEDALSNVWVAFEQYEAIATSVLLADNAFLRCVQGGQMIIQENTDVKEPGWLMNAGTIKHLSILEKAGKDDQALYLNVELSGDGNALFGVTFPDKVIIQDEIQKDMETRLAPDVLGYNAVNAFYVDGSGHIGRRVKGFNTSCTISDNKDRKDATYALKWSSLERTATIMDIVNASISELPARDAQVLNTKLRISAEDLNINNSLIMYNSFQAVCRTANPNLTPDPNTAIPIDPPRVGTVVAFTLLDDLFTGPYFTGPEQWTNYNAIVIEMYKQEQRALVDNRIEQEWIDSGSPTVPMSNSITILNPGYMYDGEYTGSLTAGIKMTCEYELLRISGTLRKYPINEIAMYSDYDNDTTYYGYPTVAPRVSLSTLVTNKGESRGSLIMSGVTSKGVSGNPDNIGNIVVLDTDYNADGIAYGSLIMSGVNSRVLANNISCYYIHSLGETITVEADLEISDPADLIYKGKRVTIDSNGFLKVSV